ncbi:hypothetical protein [Rhodococcus erythropolis]|uniref:hypothetical protein n=1 Tax=Rhodococcus erythropolis TaxID=1833 RepID=UPI003013FE8A
MRPVTAIGAAAIILSAIGISGCSDSDATGSDSSASGGAAESSETLFNESCLEKDAADSYNQTTKVTGVFDRTSPQTFAAGLYEKISGEIQKFQLRLNDEQLSNLEASTTQAVEDFVNNGGDLNSKTINYVHYSNVGDRTPGVDNTELEPVMRDGRKFVEIQADPTNDYCVSIAPKTG